MVTYIRINKNGKMFVCSKPQIFENSSSVALKFLHNALHIRACFHLPTLVKIYLKNKKKINLKKKPQQKSVM